MKLGDAIRNNDVKAVERLIKKNVDVNEENDIDGTPLELAIIFNHVKIVQMLLDAGASFSQINSSGFAAIHCAVSWRRAEILSMFIAASTCPKADVNLADTEGETPLHWAAGDKHAANIVSLLIAAGADVNLADENGLTPLRVAVASGCVKVASILLAADPNELGKNKTTSR